VPKIPHEKSKRQAELEAALSELIKDGATRLDGYKIPAEKQERKSTLALATYAAVSDRAEGILLMVQNFKPDPAFIVLRSVQEGYLNLCYVLQADDDSRLLAMFHDLAAMDVRRVGLLDECLKSLPLDENIPAGLSDDAHAAVAELAKNSDEAKAELDKLKSQEFSGKRYPDLAERVRRYDAANKAQGKQTHLMLDYRMIYFFLSQHTHLGLAALSHLIDETTDQLTLNPKDPTSDCETVLHSAFALLGDTLMLALTQIDVPTDGLLQQLQETASKLKPGTS
jgi:hypothetical protein